MSWFTGWLRHDREEESMSQKGNALATSTVGAAVHGIEAIAGHQLNDAGNGYVTATVGARPYMNRDTGQPSQDGDVLSVQPDGTLQTRAAGTTGAFEIAAKSGGFLVYAPKGIDGRV